MSNYKTMYYQKENQQIEIKQNEETGQFYLSNNQIASLFLKNRTSIYRCIKNLYSKGVINPNGTCAKIAQVGLNGKTYEIVFYTLDVVLEVGRSLKSIEGQKLKEYLIENYSQKYEIESLKDEEVIIYNNGDISIDVRVSPKEDTVWLTQEAIASLFKTTKSNISMHINNIYEDGEFFPNRTVQDSLTVGNIPPVEKDVISEKKEGKRTVRRVITYYSLDMVLAVGFRVKSPEAISFRRWAYSVLKVHLMKGYTIDHYRVLVTKDNYLELKNRVLSLQIDVNDLDSRIKDIEEKIDPKEKIFAKDTQFDSFEYLISLFNKAKEEILIMDPFFDNAALKTLIYSDKCVKKTIYVSSKANLSDEEIELFKRQYGEITIIKDNDHHDRFIYIDNKDFYLLGPSLNRIGFKYGAIVKVENKFLINYLLANLNDK